MSKKIKVDSLKPMTNFVMSILFLLATTAKAQVEINADVVSLYLPTTPRDSVSARALSRELESNRGNSLSGLTRILDELVNAARMESGPQESNRDAELKQKFQKIEALLVHLVFSSVSHSDTWSENQAIRDPEKRLSLFAHSNQTISLEADYRRVNLDAAEMQIAKTKFANFPFEKFQSLIVARIGEIQDKQTANRVRLLINDMVSAMVSSEITTENGSKKINLRWGEWNKTAESTLEPQRKLNVPRASFAPALLKLYDIEVRLSEAVHGNSNPSVHAISRNFNPTPGSVLQELQSFLRFVEPLFHERSIILKGMTSNVHTTKIFPDMAEANLFQLQSRDAAEVSSVIKQLNSSLSIRDSSREAGPAAAYPLQKFQSSDYLQTLGSIAKYAARHSSAKGDGMNLVYGRTMNLISKGYTGLSWGEAKALFDASGNLSKHLSSLRWIFERTFDPSDAMKQARSDFSALTIGMSPEESKTLFLSSALKLLAIDKDFGETYPRASELAERVVAELLKIKVDTTSDANVTADAVISEVASALEMIQRQILNDRISDDRGAKFQVATTRVAVGIVNQALRKVYNYDNRLMSPHIRAQLKSLLDKNKPSAVKYIEDLSPNRIFELNLVYQVLRPELVGKGRDVFSHAFIERLERDIARLPGDLKAKVEKNAALYSFAIEIGLFDLDATKEIQALVADIKANNRTLNSEDRIAVENLITVCQEAVQRMVTVKSQLTSQTMIVARQFLPKAGSMTFAGQPIPGSAGSAIPQVIPNPLGQAKSILKCLQLFSR